MIDTAVDTLTSRELIVGLATGAALLAGLLLVRPVIAPVDRFSSRTAATPVPVTGLLMAAGGGAAIAATSALPVNTVVGMVLLAAAGLIAGRSMLLGLIVAVPGAVFVVAAGPDDPRWVSVAVFLAIVIGGPATASFDRRYATPGLGPLLYGLSVCAVYVTVPETEGALPLMGAVVPLAITGWPLRVARLGNAGAFASVGLLAWVVATGGSTRPSAVIGGLACLGILVIEPTTRAVIGRALGAPADAKSDARRRALPIAVLHIVVLLLVSRVAGRMSSGSEAFVVTAAIVLVASATLAWWTRYQSLDS